MVSQQMNVRVHVMQRAINASGGSIATARAPHLTCTRCGQSEVRRSGPRDILSSLARRNGYKIFRCRACHASYFEET